MSLPVHQGGYGPRPWVPRQLYRDVSLSATFPTVCASECPVFPHRTFEFITSACASLAPCPRGQLACETSRQCGHGCPYCVAKTIAIMDRHCGAFIARSPFVLIASASARGQMDISPKGDAPGFVRVLDDNSLAIPDRPGNRRADTFTNVLENPKVGLIFFVPGKSETLRISGSSKSFGMLICVNRWRLVARHPTSHWFSRSKKRSFTAEMRCPFEPVDTTGLAGARWAFQALRRRWWMQPRCRCRLKHCKRSSRRTKQPLLGRCVQGEL